MVRVEQAQNFFPGSFPVITLKRFHIHSQRISLAQTGRELYLAVDEIVVLDEAANETDDNYGWHGGTQGHGNRLWKACLGKRNDGSEKKHQSASQDSQSTQSGGLNHDVGCECPSPQLAWPTTYSPV